MKIREGVTFESNSSQTKAIDKHNQCDNLRHDTTPAYLHKTNTHDQSQLIQISHVLCTYIKHICMRVCIWQNYYFCWLGHFRLTKHQTTWRERRNETHKEPISMKNVILKMIWEIKRVINASAVLLERAKWIIIIIKHYNRRLELEPLTYHT